MNGTPQDISTSCSVGQVLIERTESITRRQDRTEEDNNTEHSEFRSTLDKLRNHIPPWATVLLTITSACAGWFAKG